MAELLCTLIRRAGWRWSAARHTLLAGVAPARSLALVLLLSLLGAALAACGSDKKESPKTGLAVGDAAPAFALPASDGSNVSLDAYRGQPVLLFFHMADG